MSMASTTPTQPRRRLSKEARRAKLLAAAEDVFGDVGYHGATMELIAGRAGVARSLLYEHFTSLDDIYIECVRAARAELDARFLDASVVNQGHPRDQLRAGITAYFRFVSERGRSWDVLSGTGALPAGPIGELASELRFRTADQIAALFSQAAPEVEPAEVNAYAHVVSGGGEQLARWWRRHPEEPLETVVERFMAVVWEGLHGFVADEVR
jgi:AcrR family transcriptional regulator